MAFPFTIFLSAFLLFQIQLLMGKFLLPWFGGTAATWTECMLFFQTVLLGGYLYAHGLASLPSSRSQRRLHTIFLGLSVLALLLFAFASGTPILPNAAWRPEGHVQPVIAIAGLLLMSVGFPCFVLSTTSPLLQRWYASLSSSGSPYRLYAVSNVGSLLGLISYPLLLEPLMTLRAQAWLWFGMYTVYASGLMCCLMNMRGTTTLAVAPEPAAAAEDAPPVRDRVVLWFLLSACGSVMLYATTNMVCQDVASIPLLWIVPLIVYLATFILCFEGHGAYSRTWGVPLFLVATVVACTALYLTTDLSIPAQVIAYAFVLFAACMVCHGELYRLKPRAERLTRFYLVIAAGGVCGGALVALAAPFLFKAFWEYHAGLWACWFLLMIAFARDRDSAFYRGHSGVPFLLVGSLVLGAAFLASPLWAGEPILVVAHYMVASVLAFTICAWIDRRAAESRFHKSRAGWVRNAMVILLVALQVTLMVQVMMFLTNVVHVTRNFYGTLRVADAYVDDPKLHRYSLYHGRIMHGCQLIEPSLHALPTSYYNTESGIGLAFRFHPRRVAGQPLRIGVVGLGVGTVASYARTNDTLRFYEINRAIVDIATRSPWFSYVRDCPAPVDIAEGDGRITLEREVKRNEPPLDILVLDAFSGDAVPMHLLTLEAFELYFKRVRANEGLVVVNISNRFLDLAPVVAAAAAALNRPIATVVYIPNDLRFSSSSWMILSAGAPLDGAIDAAKLDNAWDGKLRLWTDDFSNLLGVIK